MSIIKDYLSHSTENLFQWNASEGKILKYLSTIITMSQWFGRWIVLETTTITNNSTSHFRLAIELYAFAVRGFSLEVFFLVFGFVTWKYFFVLPTLSVIAHF